MPVRIQHRGDLAAQWASVNPVLEDRELALETDTGKWKIGNGASAWTSLDYAVNATSVTSTEYASLVNRVSANSAAGGGGSVTSAEVQVASAAATSADAHANTVSARVVSVSAELASLVQIASAAATSADAHANTVSAAANVVSARVVSVSAELASLVQIASAAATSADGHANTVSARVVSVSAELASLVQIASAAATSADAHANTVSAAANVVSARVVSVSAELASLVQIASAAATSADGHANTASGAATSVNTRVNSVNTALSALSVRSVGNVSTHGLQSVLDALSNRISATGAGVASVTSAEHLSLVDRVSANSATGGAASVTSAELQVEVSNRNSADNAIIGAYDAADQAIIASLNTVSARVVSVSAELASLVQIASAAATSADGHANTVSARAVSISAELASLVQIASLAATSADGHANTVSAAANVISARVVSVSAELASLVNIASLAATSADGHANTVSARAVSISAELASLVNIVSARAVSISAEVVSLFQSASATLETHIVAASAAATSVLNIINTGLGAPQFKIVTGAQAIATATFTKVSGLSLSIAGSGIYEIHGQIVWSQSETTSTSAAFNFGMSMTAQPVLAAFRLMGNLQNFAASASIAASVLPFQLQFAGNSAISATPSIMYSAKVSAGASGAPTATMFFDGVLTGSTVQSQLKVVVATSTGDFAINVLAGSYIRAFKVG